MQNSFPPRLWGKLERGVGRVGRVGREVICVIIMFLNSWFRCQGLVVQSLVRMTQGLVWNLISYLKALRKKFSIIPLFSGMWLLDAQSWMEKIIPQRLLSKGIEKPRLKSDPRLMLISLQITRPWNQWYVFITLFLLEVFLLLSINVSIWVTPPTPPPPLTQQQSTVNRQKLMLV